MSIKGKESYMPEKKEPRQKDLVKKEEDKTHLPSEDIIQVGQTGEVLDLRGLTDEQKQELKTKYLEAMIEVGRKAAEVGVDTRALDEKLGTMAEHTRAVSESGGSITITSTQDDTIGRTEIIMGDSEAAKKGKLSRSQTGERDLTWVWIGLAAFVIIVIAIIALVR